MTVNNENIENVEITDGVSVKTNFINRIIEQDLEEGVYGDRVHTRFPPEPNGYLHIGSAYAINISYGAVQKYGGKFNLRFDDTNPAKEDEEFVQSIQEDMKWMGFDWEDRLFYGSDYFGIIYEYAVKLIKKGKAYVDDLSADEIREYRGTLTTPGKESPCRNRTIEENLDLFEKMKNGGFPSGSKVLRAKIDMASPNMNMRDPVIYRIQYLNHYRTGDQWCIYPMYDFAHPLQDATEHITHSLCSAEFIDHRPLYEWTLNECEIPNPPKQREFGRMDLKGVVMSKRYLRELVFGGYVDGWDDPRLPTLRALRRRGYTPEAIKNFLDEIGVSRNGSIVDVAMLEHSIREDLKKKVPAIMAVLKPLKVIITNYPEGQVEWFDTSINPENPEMGLRKIPFSRVLYIEQEDFMENPPKKYFRLFPGSEVRLRSSYLVKCSDFVKDENTGEILEIHCTYDPETRGGNAPDGRKVKGTLHWVSAEHAVKAEVRLYERLMKEDEEQDKDAEDWKVNLNQNSLTILDNCYIEPSIEGAKPEDKFQFIRNGYFCVDRKYSTDEKLVFNRIVSLKDSWKKQSNE